MNKYYRKPFIVEAWPVTLATLEDVAKWCNGRVDGLSITFPRIRDKTKPLGDQDRYSYAVCGTVVIKTNQGFAVMPGKEFASKYAPANAQ